MSDTLTKQQRSYCMSRIRSKNTKPEILLRLWLRSKGIGYRFRSTTLLGKPDVILSKYHTLIFVNGCFWHMHQDCRFSSIPKTNTEYWKNKLECNRRRDMIVQESLRQDGWRIIVIWECQIKNEAYIRILEDELLFPIMDRVN